MSKHMKRSNGTDKDERETPKSFFKELDKTFHFVFDVCATRENAKCQNYFDKEKDGLLQPWPNTGDDGASLAVWCNPPYSDIENWVYKAYKQKLLGTTTVMLLPVRTGTDWFSALTKYPGVQICFLRERLKFGGSQTSAPFDCMLVIFRANRWFRSLHLPPEVINVSKEHRS